MTFGLLIPDQVLCVGRADHVFLEHSTGGLECCLSLGRSIGCLLMGPGLLLARLIQLRSIRVPHGFAAENRSMCLQKSRSASGRSLLMCLQTSSILKLSMHDLLVQDIKHLSSLRLQLHICSKPSRY